MEPLMSLPEVAAVLGVSKQTLYSWHRQGSGPKGAKVGQGLRYRAEDVRSFVDAAFAEV
jgi:excisionase family DNA binding protein